MAKPTASASRGRKQAPRNLKLLHGTSPGRDSGGRKVAPEIPFERGPLMKPETLSRDASWMWDQVVDQMESIGLLKPLDALALEVVCETFARMREAVRKRQSDGLLNENSQGVVAGQWVGIEERAARDFRSWCAEFGLTPASEKNLRSGDPDDGGIEDNPFR